MFSESSLALELMEWLTHTAIDGKERKLINSLKLIPCQLKFCQKNCSIKQWNHKKYWNLLLAQYLFSFLVLFVFFKQPSHTKLSGKRFKYEKLNRLLWKSTVIRQIKTEASSYPDGHIVSWCKTQIWCILRPQSKHSTNLKRENRSCSPNLLSLNWLHLFLPVLWNDNSQLWVQCVILLLLKLILVNWSEIN